MEGPKRTPGTEKVSSFESMDFEQFESNKGPMGEVFQKVALEHLKTKQKDYFDREFTGALDDEGYLIRKDGKPAYTMPSQNFSGTGMNEVVETTKAKLREMSSKPE